MTAGPGNRAPAGVVVGVGVASAATPEEVAGLVAAALAEVGRVPADVTAVATIATRRHHPAIVALGVPVIAYTAANLAAAGAAGDTRDARHAGDAADAASPAGRLAVAEPAALLAAGGAGSDGGGGGAVLLVPKRRSARATVAVAAPLS